MCGFDGDLIMAVDAGLERDLTENETNPRGIKEEQKTWFGGIVTAFIRGWQLPTSGDYRSVYLG